MEKSSKAVQMPENKVRAPNKRASKPRDASRHSILRYLAMLQFIPRGPESKSTKEIFEAIGIDGLGYDVSLKTIQRDLMKLMDDDYCLIYEEKDGGYYWSYLPGSPTWVFPAGMEEYVALSVVMADKFLTPIMPDAFNAMPSFKSAQDRISISRIAQNKTSKRDNYVSQWIDKVHVMSLEFVRPTPSIDPEIKETVYSAVEFDQFLWIRYQDFDEVTGYYIHPLGLIYRGHVVCLIGMDDEDRSIRSFALHRIVDVADIIKDRDVKHARPAGFNLATYAEKEFGLGREKTDTLLITLWLDKDAAAELEDSPIAEGQDLKPMKGGGFKLMATVPNSLELRRFIRSFGAQVEVLGPKVLRKEFASTADTLAKLYCQGDV